MCQIWLKESEVMLPRVFWDSINSKNKEGIGIYNIDKDEIFKSQDYEKGWEYITSNKSDKMVVHHRMSTSGAKTEAQLHGWDMGNGYVFFHNGVLRTYSGNAKESDTQQLVAEWHGAPVNALVRYLEAMESNSRFVLVNKETGSIILPNCATWNPVAIQELGGRVVRFSNDYAFDYQMLPPRYSRWDGYDANWNNSGHKTAYRSVSGARSKQAVTSVFDKKLSVLTLEGKASDWESNPKRSTYVNSKAGVEAFIAPRSGYLVDGIVMPDVLRIVGTDRYIFADDLAEFHTKKCGFYIDNSYAEQITMNDLLQCESAEIAMAYVRIARSHALNVKLNTMRNSDLYAYLRSYEMRIGVREGLDFTLYEYLHIVMTFEAKKGTEISDSMRRASIFSNAIAEELSGDFSYFKSLVKRVHKNVQGGLDKEAKKLNNARRAFWTMDELHNSLSKEDYKHARRWFERM